MLDFDALVKFIDDYSVHQLYWQVSVSEVNIEIQWSSREWKLRPLGSLFWHIVSGESFQKTLEVYGIDVVSFKNQLVAACMEQIVGAHFILEMGKNTFGEETVEQAIKTYDDFGQKLIATLNDVLEDKTGKDSIVAHLKLVKPPTEH